MIGTLDELLVVSDIDNTLLNAVEGLPEVNRATVQLFSSMGGRFTVATGRTVESVRRYLGDVAISAPVIALGGAVIYDFAQEQYIQNITLNKESAMAALREVQQNFPGVGIEVMTADGAIQIVQANEYTHMLTVQERLIYLLCPLADIRQEWNKVLFAGPPELMRAVAAWAADTEYPDIYFVSTNDMYFEVMPQGASKGHALKTLCEYLNIPPANSVAIGDYYNDIELMRAAGHSVAMGNAPKEVQVEADEVTGNCMDGGVAQVLYRLIDQYSEAK